jgi:histidinol-phosphate/aromatic aminotransferase/cobyric acid decarboxylase-like protein
VHDSSGSPAHGGNLTWAAALAGCSPFAILDFSASINPCGPPKSAIVAIQTHLDALPHYPDPSYRALRQAIAAEHEFAKLGLDADWILPGNGSAELLTWAGRELATLPTTYLLTPAFGDYQRALKAFGATIVGCPLPLQPVGEKAGGRRQEAEDRRQKVEGRRQKVEGGRQEAEGRRQEAEGRRQEAEGEPESYQLESTSSLIPHPSSLILHPSSLIPHPSSFPSASGLLLNNPHNPSGCLFSVETIVPLLHHLRLVVIDEAFMDFLQPDQQQSLISLIRDYPNLVILRSLTKFYSLPGLRLGYAVAHPDRLRQWQQWRDPWAVNVLAEAAAVAVLSDRAFQQQTWEWLPQARSMLFQGLAALPGLQPLPSAANFLLVRADYSVGSLQQQLLQQHQILIRDCHSFPELGDRYFRVAVRTFADNQRLLDGLADILSSYVL